MSLAVVALVSWGCESDFYNEHMIDGYEPETEITDVQSIEYTLTEDDYSTISKNSTNKTNAEAAGQEAVDALAAIGKNKYFANPDEAAAYVPAFLASAYPTLDNNSIVMVGYTTALDIPAEMQIMNAATEYTLSEDDYKTIWGEEEYVKAVTPATIAKVKTVIPSEAFAKISMRLVPGQTVTCVRDAVVSHLEKHLPRGMTMEICDYCPGASGFRLPLFSPLLRKFFLRSSRMS